MPTDESRLLVAEYIVREKNVITKQMCTVHNLIEAYINYVMKAMRTQIPACVVSILTAFLTDFKGTVLPD
jgi:hypothetical protein